MQGQLKLRKPQNLTVTRQYSKTLRVEFTLTKLQEDFPEQKKNLRQITQAHKIFNESNGNKILRTSDTISQADQHAKALQKPSKLKTSSGSRLYGNIFKQIWTTSTISLKDEHILSSISCTL